MTKIKTDWPTSKSAAVHGKLTERGKLILRWSLEVYNTKSGNDKELLRRSVRVQLMRHKKAVHMIGVGLDPDYVRAGELFLRITKFEELC